MQDTVEEVATAIVGRAQQYCLHFQCSWGISEYEYAIQCSMENLTKDYTLLSTQNQPSTRIAWRWPLKAIDFCSHFSYQNGGGWQSAVENVMGRQGPISPEWNCKHPKLPNLEWQIAKNCQRNPITFTKGNCLMWFYCRNCFKLILLREHYATRTSNLFFYRRKVSRYVKHLCLSGTSTTKFPPNLFSWKMEPLHILLYGYRNCYIRRL